jgi:hypothetical protein
LLKDGQELPVNRWGYYVVADARGGECVLVTDFNWRQMSPTVRSEQQTVMILPALPKAVQVVMVVFLVLAVLGGGVGALLGFGAVLTSGALLRHPGRRSTHVIGACLSPVAAVLLFIVVVHLLR